MQHQTDIKARCKIDQVGRITIPADLRQQLQVGPGDEVFLEVHDGQMTVSTFQVVVHELQQEIEQKATPAGSVVDELLVERRAEATRE